MIDIDSFFMKYIFQDPFNNSSKEQHLLKNTYIFLYIYLINVMHSCWIKVYVYVYKKRTDPKLLNGKKKKKKKKVKLGERKKNYNSNK